MHELLISIFTHTHTHTPYSSSYFSVETTIQKKTFQLSINPLKMNKFFTHTHTHTANRDYYPNIIIIGTLYAQVIILETKQQQK